MQRYRVNYGLLIGLSVGLMVVGVGGYFGLRYQLDRNADQLLSRAEEAVEAGELRDATGILQRYCRQRPEDAVAAERMANLYNDILQQPDVEPEDYGNAASVMESVIRVHADGGGMPELRRELAKLYMLFRRWIDALKHVDVLVKSDPKDPELQRLRVNCLLNANEKEKATDYLCKLVGFNKRASTFDEEDPIGDRTVELYPLLANLVVDSIDEVETGRGIVNQMVEVNPESATARVLRARYLLRLRGEDEEQQEVNEELADADFAEALRLDPKDLQVLLASALRKQDLEDYDEARVLLESAKQEFPDQAGVYQALSRLELATGGENLIERAIAPLNTGIEKSASYAQPSLIFAKAELLANSNDQEGLRKAIKKLEQSQGLRIDRLDFLRAREAMMSRDWHKATKLFEKVRPIAAGTRLAGPTNYLIGVCYEQLGQYDLASDALSLAVELQPNNENAQAALARIERRVRPSDFASRDNLTSLVVEMLEKPEDQQDWGQIDEEVKSFIEERELPEVMRDVLQADILMRRDRLEEARALVDKALRGADGNRAVLRPAVLLVARDPERGPVEALRLYQELIEPDFYGLPTMRLLKADLLIGVDDEALTEQLFSLLDGTEEWPTAGRIGLMKGLARKFAQIRDVDSRRKLLQQVAELSPGELATLLELFQTALASREKEAVLKAQQNILDVVGSKEDPTWLFTEAARLTFEAVQDENDPVKLAKANDLIDRAMSSRPSWNLLHLTRADIAFARGDAGAALAALDKAKELGPMAAASLVRHIALLSQAGRFGDARKALESTSSVIRERLLGRQYAEILLNTGSTREAVDSATRLGEAAPDNAGLQLWLGRFLRQVALRPKTPVELKESTQAKSLEALESAVALAPDSAEGWLELVVSNAARGDRDATEDVLRRAQVALPTDQSTGVLARGYELIGRFFDAENLYRTIEKRRPDDLGVKRQFATFYLSPRYPREDGRLKATRLINKILAAGEEAADQDESPSGGNVEAQVRWARRAAAELLSRSRGYQDLLKAERLLERNQQGGQANNSDRVLMAQLLSRRPEPASRLRAIELLEEIQDKRPLPSNLSRTLGQLYFSTGNWEDSRTQMKNVIAADPKDPEPRAAFIRMLLRREDSTSLNEAARQVKMLRELAPNSPGTAELIARVLTKFGREEEVRKALLPLISGKQSSSRTALRVAALLAELGDIATAEKIYSRMAAQGPAGQLSYASFIGQYKDPEAAFDLLDTLRDEATPPQIARVALGIVRKRRDDAGDSIDEKAKLWIDRGLREDPEATDLLLMRAELLDIQGRYDEATSVYRLMLDGGELTGAFRAVVLNNVAYLIALSSEDAESAELAMGYVAEAVDILGPTADILDTRAVVFIAQDKPAEAIADLELALIDSPTGSKHFHKSRAHMLAQEIGEAVEEWDKAIELGFTRDDVAGAELSAYDKLASKFAEIRRRSGTN